MVRWHGGARAVCVAVTVLAGAVAAAATPAQAAAPAGPRYVIVHRHGSHVVLRPTPRLVKNNPGRRITVTCFSVARELPDGTSTQASVDDRTRLHPGVVFPVDRGAGDYCFVRLGARHGVVPTQQEIGLTRRGSRHLQLRRATLLLVSYMTAAYALDPPHVPTTQTLAETMHLVALDSPDAPPAPGATGIWTDGTDRVVVATTLPDGRRIFVDYDRATNVTRTNVLDVIIELGES